MVNNFDRSSQIKDQEVYELLLAIPPGKVSTYGDIANALGHPHAARLIGNILKRNPNPIHVPCHRIIKSNGMLGGYMYGTLMKKRLLEEEGIKFQADDYMRDFDKCRMDLKKLEY
ncbi:MAG TPA: MGMT family protein [Nitrososphaeraceae archaeon]|nr:MGMT family protein [Nitrososphaeraceae archaeon]